MFFYPTTHHSQRAEMGVCATTCCVQRDVMAVCTRRFYVCKSVKKQKRLELSPVSSLTVMDKSAVLFSFLRSLI